MVPKVGDIVRFNKKAIDSSQHLKTLNLNTENILIVTMLKTRRNPNPIIRRGYSGTGEYISITVRHSNGSFGSRYFYFGIWSDTGRFYDTPPNSPPLFILAGKKVNDLDNLKMLNTKPEATVCASCGQKLKDPGMGPIYKHCPKCEP